MDEERLLQELEGRLDENRRVAATTPLPRFLLPAAAYLGFHTFRTLVLASLGVTVLLWLVLWEKLMILSQKIFLLPG